MKWLISPTPLTIGLRGLHGTVHDNEQVNAIADPEITIRRWRLDVCQSSRSKALITRTTKTMTCHRDGRKIVAIVKSQAFAVPIMITIGSLLRRLSSLVPEIE